MASALSPGWREAGLENYRRLLALGATSICFDQFFPWNEPNLNPERDGRPGDEGEKLLEFGERARELILAEHADGTFSGEGVADASVPVLDYPGSGVTGMISPIRAVPLRLPTVSIECLCQRASAWGNRDLRRGWVPERDAGGDGAAAAGFPGAH